MFRCYQSLHRFFLHHKPLSSWSDASAKPTAPHKDVHAEGMTYHAQNYVRVTQENANDEDCNFGNDDSDDDDV